MESLYEELARAGIVQGCQAIQLRDFIGSPNLAGRGTVPGDVLFEPSPADIRAALTVFFILPLGSAYIHDRWLHITITIQCSCRQGSTRTTVHDVLLAKPA